MGVLTGALACEYVVRAYMDTLFRIFTKIYFRGEYYQRKFLCDGKRTHSFWMATTTASHRVLPGLPSKRNPG